MDKETEKLIFDLIMFTGELQRAVDNLCGKLLKFHNHLVDQARKEVKPDDES